MIFNDLKIILKSHGWQTFQLISLNFFVLFNFFSLILIKEGISKHIILLFFSIFYISNVIVLLLTTNKYIDNGKKILTTLISLFLLFILIFNLNSKYGYLFLFISTGLLFLIKEFTNINFLKEIYLESEKNNIDSQNLITLSLFIGMLLPSFYNPFMGFLFNININYGLSLIFISMLLSLYFVAKRNKNIIKIKSPILDFKQIPNSVYLQCLLSLFYNNICFFCKFFLIPFAILKFSQEYGFSKDVFKILGLFLGLSALLSFIKLNKIKKINSFNLMLTNYFIGIICFLIIIVDFCLFKNHILKNQIVIISLFIVTFIIIEITTKLWSAGFIESLNQIVRNINTNEDAQENNHNKIFSIFMIFKSLGGFFGFFITFLFYNLLNFEYIMFFTIFIGIAYGFFYYLTEKNN